MRHYYLLMNLDIKCGNNIMKRTFGRCNKTLFAVFISYQRPLKGRGDDIDIVFVCLSLSLSTQIFTCDRGGGGGGGGIITTA